MAPAGPEAPTAASTSGRRLAYAAAALAAAAGAGYVGYALWRRRAAARSRAAPRAGEGAGAGEGEEERPPTEELVEDFEAAVAYVSMSDVALRAPNALKLRMYGLYKRATVGRCAVGRPGLADPAGRAKWDAWNAAEVRQMSQAEAMANYIATVVGFMPDQPGALGGAGPSGDLGFSVSTLANAEEPGEPLDTLQGWTVNGDAAKVVASLEGGAAVDGVDEEGCTALHFAADRGHVDIIEVLVGRGASVDAQDLDGQTPLHYAALCDRREAYVALVRAGAREDLEDVNGESAASWKPAGW